MRAGPRPWSLEEKSMTHEQQAKRSAGGRSGRLGHLGRAALAAAEAGLSVFPLHPGSKYPALHGQRDCDGGGVCVGGHNGWEQRATRDPRQITAWWRQRPWNLGIATGPSGLVVIDLDDGHGEAAPERWTGARNGREVLARLAQEAGQPGPWATYQVSTPTVIYGSRVGSQHCQRRATCVARGLDTSALSPGFQRRVAAAASSRAGDLR